MKDYNFNQLQQIMLIGLQAKAYLDGGAEGLSDKEKKDVYEFYNELYVNK